jgi:hypothetical protein
LLGILTLPSSVAFPSPQSAVPLLCKIPYLVLQILLRCGIEFYFPERKQTEVMRLNSFLFSFHLSNLYYLHPILLFLSPVSKELNVLH